jgi:hypothetical protein
MNFLNNRNYRTLREHLQLRNTQVEVTCSSADPVLFRPGWDSFMPNRSGKFNASVLTLVVYVAETNLIQVVTWLLSISAGDQDLVGSGLDRWIRSQKLLPDSTPIKMFNQAENICFFLLNISPNNF